MKKVLLLLMLGSYPIILSAQVQVRPLPSAGYESRIREFIDNMRVVDTHEHIMKAENLKKRTSLDFMLLLQGYSDLRGAGLMNTFSINEGLAFSQGKMENSKTVLGGLL